MLKEKLRIGKKKIPTTTKPIRLMKCQAITLKDYLQ